MFYIYVGRFFWRTLFESYRWLVFTEEYTTDNAQTPLVGYVVHLSWICCTTCCCGLVYRFVEVWYV